MRFAICDDEENIRLDISNNIKRYLPLADICTFASGEHLLDNWEAFDILFLDIQLEGLDGMETARKLRIMNQTVTIIFVTAHEKYVFEAFDVNAFHYLSKPIDNEKFRHVLKQAVNKNSRKSTMNNYDTNSILIKCQNTSRIVYTKDIYYAEVFNRKVTIYTTNGNFEYYAKLTDLEKQLGHSFYRCHRSYLVNLTYISSYTRECITLVNGCTVQLANPKYAAFVKCYLSHLKKECTSNE